MLRKLFLKIKRRLMSQPDFDALVKRGLRIGDNVSIGHDVQIDYSYAWLIEIGNNCTLATGVILLTHDSSTSSYLDGSMRIGRISIGDNVFIGMRSIVLPGATIGNNVIIGAGSVITKDVPDNVVVAGNPARIISTVQEYQQKHKNQMINSPVYPSSKWTAVEKIVQIDKDIMNKQLNNTVGYISPLL
jgi:maltose O-acetyltransferase